MFLLLHIFWKAKNLIHLTFLFKEAQQDLFRRQSPVIVVKQKKDPIREDNNVTILRRGKNREKENSQLNKNFSIQLNSKDSAEFSNKNICFSIKKWSCQAILQPGKTLNLNLQENTISTEPFRISFRENASNRGRFLWEWTNSHLNYYSSRDRAQGFPSNIVVNC